MGKKPKNETSSTRPITTKIELFPQHDLKGNETGKTVEFKNQKFNGLDAINLFSISTGGKDIWIKKLHYLYQINYLEYEKALNQLSKLDGKERYFNCFVREELLENLDDLRLTLQEISEKNKIKLNPSTNELNEKIHYLNALRQHLECLLATTESKKTIKSNDFADIASSLMKIGALTILSGIHHYPDAISGRRSRRAAQKSKTDIKYETKSRKRIVINEIKKLITKNPELSVNAAAKHINKNWDSIESLQSEENVSTRTIRAYWQEAQK
jgi:hypothetical protein